MRILKNLLASLIIAAWLGAIAVISIQNITPVSFQLFNYRSIEIPLGVWLAFSVGAGFVFAAFSPFLFPSNSRSQRRQPRKKKRQRRESFKEDIAYERDPTPEPDSLEDWGEEGSREW